VGAAPIEKIAIFDPHLELPTLSSASSDIRAWRDDGYRGMAAAPAAAAATTACAENPLFPVPAAGAAAVAPPATTADGGADSAARQPAPLQAAPVVAAQRAVLGSCATASFSTAAPVGVGARAATGRAIFSAAPSPAATPAQR